MNLPKPCPAGLLLLVAATLASCGSEARTPSLPELPPDAWTEVRPGGAARCADGSPYAFFVRPGSANGLVVNFMGGGACWNASTCHRPWAAGASEPGFYLGRVHLSAGVLSDPSSAVGLHAWNTPANPVADWHQVYLPYCTGDLHLGDATVVYADDLTVHHRGAANVRAALGWVADRFASPDHLFVTGCSAGAYASIFWTPLLRSTYPAARMAQLADSGAGVITRSFVADGLVGWNVAASLPFFVPGMPPDDLLRVDALERLYHHVGARYPDATLAQYNTLFDGVQTYFYGEMLNVLPDLGLALEWSDRMLASVDALEDDVPSFHSYVVNYDFDLATGTPHCIVTRDDLYSLTADGTSFVDWLEALLDGRDAGNVRAVY